MRSRIWATAIEKYYWPIGSYGKARRATADLPVAFNDIRAQSAQESIRTAVQQLKTDGSLPRKATARAKAIRRAQASLGSTASSLGTLYKSENKQLWHPDYQIEEQSSEEINTLPVIPSASDTLNVQKIDALPPIGSLGSCEDKELRTKEKIMKCRSYEHDALVSSKTKFFSERGVRGEFSSFPQFQPKSLVSEAFPGKTNRKTVRHKSNEKSLILKERLGSPKLRQSSSNSIRPTIFSGESDIHHSRKGISQTVADTITTTQSIVQRLGWPVERVKAFIAKKFQGRRRFQLSDDEALELLYYLQVQYLEAH